MHPQQCRESSGPIPIKKQSLPNVLFVQRFPNKTAIELQGQANPIHDNAVAALCTELNATETHYP